MKIKEFVVFLSMIFLCCGVAVAGISFVDPTPANNSRICNNYSNINVSIPIDDLTNFTFNWNGTNTTYLNDSCVLHLSFDNNSVIGDSSTVVRDVSSYNNNGSFVNGSTGNWTTDGKWNGAMSFDGVNDCIFIPHDNSLNLTGKEMVLAAWVKWEINPSTGNNWAAIINKFGDNEWRLQHNMDNSHFEFTVGSGHVISTTDVQEDVWYYVVGAYNNTHLLIYVNGILENTFSYSSVIPISGSDVYIGRRTFGDRFFNGIIDEVCIYNRVLSLEEIQQFYMSNLRKFNKNQWYFETNQTELINNTTYNYQAFANNITNSYLTDYRLLYVGFSLPYIPPNSINITNTTGDDWIKHLWDVGIGNVTDSYNVSVNNIWYNTTIDTYYQKTYTTDAWQNITVYAYNNSGNGILSVGNISQNTFLTYVAPRPFFETIEIIEDFPQAINNILTSFLSFLPLFIGILISGFLILVCVGVFGKLKRW